MDALAAGLIGTGVGALLAFAGQAGMTWLSERREARAAALMIFAELTAGYVAFQTFLEAGAWIGPRPARRSAWEGFGPTLVRGSSVEEIGAVAMAYSALDDVEDLLKREVQSSDSAYATLFRRVRAGLRDVGRRAGLGAEEMEFRLGNDPTATPLTST